MQPSTSSSIWEAQRQRWPFAFLCKVTACLIPCPSRSGVSLHCSAQHRKGLHGREEIGPTSQRPPSQRHSSSSQEVYRASVQEHMRVVLDTRPRRFGRTMLVANRKQCKLALYADHMQVRRHVGACTRVPWLRVVSPSRSRGWSLREARSAALGRACSLTQKGGAPAQCQLRLRPAHSLGDHLEVANAISRGAGCGRCLHGRGQVRERGAIREGGGQRGRCARGSGPGGLITAARSINPRKGPSTARACAGSPPTPSPAPAPPHRTRKSPGPCLHTSCSL